MYELRGISTEIETPTGGCAGNDPQQTFALTPNQQAALELLSGPSNHILLFGGSRSGKTFLLVLALFVRAIRAPRSTHAIFRYRYNHIRWSVFQQTIPAVRDRCCPGLPLKLNAVESSVTFPNGSEILLGGLDQKDRTEKILGQEYSTIYFNECSQIPYPSVLMAQTRLAQKSGLKNRFFYDANPPSTSHWLHRLFVEKVDPITGVPLANPAGYASMRLNPAGNSANLATGYLEELAQLPERLRRRFLDGEWTADNPHALWTSMTIDQHRVLSAPALRRVVVGVDPAVSAKEGSDETGIVVAGVADDGHYFVLEDASLVGSPLDWARNVVSVYQVHRADRVVAEVNQGGDLVVSNIRCVDPAVRIKPIHSMRGKVLRAEPIAGLYEQGLVHHVGLHPHLEAQMFDWDPADTSASANSPDRVDALVFALTDLMAARQYSRPLVSGIPHRAPVWARSRRMG